MASSSNKQEVNNFEPMDSVFYEAAEKGDISMFKHAGELDQILTVTGNTILHIYIKAQINAKIHFVREILEMCPKLLWKANKKGETLLHMAVRHEHADVAKYLLENCKDTSDQELGITPTKATRQMLQMTSHEAKDTALHEAVRSSYNDLKVVELLTTADGELPYDVNTDGETPLYLAAERGYIDVLKTILRDCSSPADHGPYDRTALHVAVIRKDEGMVDTLLGADEKIIHKSKQDQQGWMPLHFAAHSGYIEILRKLLEKDKSAAYKISTEGKTALHIAAGLGRVNVMQALMSTCPDCCEMVDKRGRNVLHFALESRNKKAVKLILDNPSFGNLINEKDENGNTPFLQAVSAGMGFSVTKHPKRDMQVFNHDNHNATDIMLAVNSNWFYGEFMPDPMFRLFEKIKSIDPKFPFSPRLRMIVSEDDNIGERKNEGNTVKSKSKEGEVEDEGNRRSSKSNDGKGKNRNIINFLEEARQNELVAATLIATVTFAAGFTVPGGFVADKGPDQGAAILTRNTAFRAFVILNNISFILSSLAVFNHISIASPSADRRDKRKLFKQTLLGQGLINYAIGAMIGAFISATCAVLREDKSLTISACVVPVAVFAFLRINNYMW